MAYCRRIQFILAHEKYESIVDVLCKIDSPHSQCAYDGATVTMTTAAVTAMATRVLLPFAAGDFVYEALIRNYTIPSSVFRFTDILASHEATAIRRREQRAYAAKFVSRFIPENLGYSSIEWIGAANFSRRAAHASLASTPLRDHRVNFACSEGVVEVLPRL